MKGGNTRKELRAGSAPIRAKGVLRRLHVAPARQPAPLSPEFLDLGQAAVRVEPRIKRKGFFQGNLFTFLLLCSLAFVLYCPTLNSGLQVDDLWWFDSVKHGIFGLNHVQLGFWRPGISIVFWLMWKVFGLYLPAFRIFNMLLAATAAYGLRCIWLRMFRNAKHAGWQGAAVGVLFLVWPSHPETTAWIAGMTDGLSITLGILAIWAYISYRQDLKPLYLVLAAALLVAAMLSKEAAFTFPLICFLLASIAAPWKRTEIKEAAMHFVSMLGLMACYIVIRSHFIGKLVGGYTNTTHTFARELFGTSFSINLSHAYLPFDRLLANWQDAYTVHRVLILALFVAGALVVRVRPRTATITERMKRVLSALLLVWFAIWLYYISCLPVLEAYYFAITALDGVAAGTRVLALLLLAGLCALAFTKGRPKRAWTWLSTHAKTLHIWLDPEIHPLALPIAFTVLTYLQCHDVWYGQCAQYLIVLGCFWVIYVTRPITPQSVDAGEMMARTRASNVALACFAASLLALLPACLSGLPVSFRGEFRLTYAATAFSVLALVTFFCSMFQSPRSQIAAVACCGAVALSQLVPNVETWRQSGLVARRTEQVIKGMLPARRIYVLVAPADIEGAGLYSIDMELLASDLYGDQNVKTLLLFREMALSRDDRIEAHRVGTSDYDLVIRDSNPKRPDPLITFYDTLVYRFFSSDGVLQKEKYDPNVQLIRFAGGGRLATGAIIHLLGFQPSTDRVMIVNASGARRLDL